MFKRGFTLPNVIALILGLCAAIYFAQANKSTERPLASPPTSGQYRD